MGKQTSDSLFILDDFRPYLRTWARTKGRGEYLRIAKALKMHTTLVSQVAAGKKKLTEEQAYRLTHYFGLNALETDYFLKLVLLDRAGTERLKQYYRSLLKQLRNQVKEVKHRVPVAKNLSEADRALFYSSWQYSFIRLLTSIPHLQTAEEIARFMNLSLPRIWEILHFLISRDLCRETSTGHYIRTEKNTHIEAGSPLAIRHHQNWRARSFELQERMTSEDLVFTAPIALSEKCLPKVRSILLDAIAAIAKIVEDSPSETVAYLGIDWIKMNDG